MATRTRGRAPTDVCLSTILPHAAVRPAASPLHDERTVREIINVDEPRRPAAFSNEALPRPAGSSTQVDFSRRSNLPARAGHSLHHQPAISLII